LKNLKFLFRVTSGKGFILFENFDKLLVWQRAHSLVLKIYEVTNSFPKEEIWGLTSQIRRSAVSVPSNIVEGKARGSRKDFKRFLLIARGSLEEVKYQSLLAKELKYMNDEQYEEITVMIEDVGRLLGGMIRKVG
jgi:four helix bundle protein